ncbi:MAG: hypothetical protein M3P18_07395, partial [Actinomycetota bacterium]|nr:hypothetical protein [Actinomycetota bacterium]
MDLDDLDWGNVPAWLGAGSLILAYLVFMRDRTSSERAQVDLVGAWTTVEYERSAPDVSPRVESGMVTGHVRNASELPVRVAQIAYKVELRWMVEDLAQSHLPDGPGVWSPQAGTEPWPHFQDNILVPPQETKELRFGVNVAHMAPEGAVQLHLLDGIRAQVKGYWSWTTPGGSGRCALRAAEERNT